MVVGGGASGALVAIALQQAGIRSTQIDIAEPSELLGEGLAYQTRDPLHRLNVPAEKMSAIEELPTNFAEWSGAPSYTFMPRGTYGTYLRNLLDVGISHIKEYVVDFAIEPNNQVNVTFASGITKNYKALLLAMGHGKARIPEFLMDLPASPRIIQDVWDGGDLPQCRNLLCFGTGLTFVDVAMTHLARGPLNTVIAVSGSGNLPEPHAKSQIAPLAPTLSEVDSLEKLRFYFAKAGDSWREAADGLRPIMEAVWRSFSIEERDEFLRTEGSLWSRRRHRIAPDVADRVSEEMALGRITVRSGKVSKINFVDDEVSLTLEDGHVFVGDYLALCIGRDYELSDPLTLNLLADGKTSRGPLGMGLSVDVSTGLLLKPNGDSYSNIYALGPLRSGEAFETTAIPEIRKQATMIAQRLFFG